MNGTGSIDAGSNVFDLSGHFPLLHFSDQYELQTYFIVVSLALCICVLFLVRRAERRGLDRNTALDLSLALMGFGMLGARLFHVLFEEPSYYAADPWRILEFWRGGFVWYGGALLGAAASLIYLRVRHLPMGIWLDLFAPVAALGYALGRIACFLTGCCYGSVCVLSSGFKFRHPTQLYAVISELLTLWFLLWIERRSKSPPGRLFSLWLILHGCGRIFMEAFRVDPRGPEPLGLSLATWLSGILIAFALGFEIWRAKSAAQAK